MIKQNWVIIVAKIILLILQGMSKNTAVSTASSLFNISETEIWKHGGF